MRLSVQLSPTTKKQAKIPSRYKITVRLIHPATFPLFLTSELTETRREEERRGFKKKAKQTKNYAYMILFLSIELESKQKTCLSCSLSLNSLSSLSTNRK
jgi:hypothetical protein